MHTAKKVKSVVRAALALLTAAFIVILMSFSQGVRAQSRAIEPDLTVHEWGTFTSIAGKNGNAVEWTPLNGVWPLSAPLNQKGDVKTVKLSSPVGTSELPGFVEHFGYAGFKAGLRGTIRMETPVLYFYSPRDLTVSVNVAFSKGVITEWYPHANVSRPEGFSPASLYKGNANGAISWNRVHIEPAQNVEFPRESGGHHYYAARETSAVPVRVTSPTGDQHEKFLFYRGVSAGPVPISAKVTADGRLLVSNLGKEEIPAVILFERRGEKLGYRISNNLQSQFTLDLPELNANIDILFSDLEVLLMAQGLYRDEAHAMVQTWRSSWFEEGSRLFYIVPPSYVNGVLPLTINPAPAQTVRVFIGRMELVTPATERAVETALAAHDQTTLDQYARFLEPILRIISEKDPAKGKHLADLLNGPCPCEENKPCDQEVKQARKGQ